MSHGGTAGGGIPDLDKLPAPLRTVIESAYGHGVGDVFLYAAPTALLALLLVLFIKEVALKSKPAAHAPTAATATATATADSAQ